MFGVKENIEKYEAIYEKGQDHNYPNIDLVRLESFFFNKKRGGKLLDYGFGAGQNLKFYANLGYEVYGLETSKKAIELVREKLKLANLDQYKKNVALLNISTKKLPYDSNFFDFIVCSSVLSLVGGKENIIKLINEFYRMLKIGGKLIVDINGPNSDFAKKHIKVNADEYESILKKNGEEFLLLTYCPQDIDSFISILSKFSNIEKGTTSFKYFNQFNDEFIACAIK